MSNKFDLEVAKQLIAALKSASKTMSDQSNSVQKSFKALGDTFKDQGYTAYQADLNAADKTMAGIIADIEQLNKALSDYTNKMGEILQ